MADKRSFVVYAEVIDFAGDLTDEQLGQLYRAQLLYASGQEPTVTDPEVRGIWRVLRHRMDVDAEKYENKCKQMRANASGRKQKQADATESQQIGGDTDTDNDTDIKKNTPNGVQKEKPQKYEHGKCGHVMLTDDELQKLIADYGNDKAYEAIDYLDEYIELKGYKAKSHYLALRKWVFDALREADIRQQELEQREQRLRASPKKGGFEQRKDDLDADMQEKALAKIFDRRTV